MSVSRASTEWFCGVRWIAAAIVLGMGQACYAVTIFDDFTDGNDTANPTWTHLSNAVGSTGQSWTVTPEGRYRLQAPSNGDAHPALIGYGFVGSYVEQDFTHVRVTADFIDFPGSDASGGAVGGFMSIAARLNGNDGPPLEGTGIQLLGYSYQYEAPARGGQGEMVLNILHGGGFKDIGSDPVMLEEDKSYRLIFEVTGNVLHGQTWEIDSNGNQIAMVGEKIRDLDAQPVGNIDNDGDPNTPDVEFVPYTHGHTGIYGVGHAFYKDVDFTIDNFRAESLALAADFDNDNDVDAADLALWQGDFGVNADSDADGDGDSDGNDFLVWQRELGGAAPTATAAVPEPTALTLILAAGMTTLGACRKAARRRG